MQGGNASGEFIFESAEAAPRRSCLYEEHLKLTEKSRIVPFAGYLMPLWYSSISIEHKAVRDAAGIFDCTHMGVLDVAGPEAAEWLDCITTNEVASLGVGAARYSYILDAAGNVLDDVIIYRRRQNRFMVVVNAANEPKIKAYLDALQAGAATVDVEQPGRKLPSGAEIRDMTEESGEDCRVDIAVQGPRSADVLARLISERELQKEVKGLRPFHFVEGRLGAVECLISRTGYTGAGVGFELFVHPAEGSELWQMLLKEGQQSGLVPCGLGARDSLRIEAGLPLYGHELAGRFGISPFEAGYGWAVKLRKDFFIGRGAMQRRAKMYDMEVVRVELPGARGVRPVRADDGVLDKAGGCIGWVTSCAKAGERQIALSYIETEAVTEGDSVGIYYLARNKGQVEQGRKEQVQRTEQLEADIGGAVTGRFVRF